MPCHNIRLLHVRSQVAGRETILHGQRIEERLDGRTHLATSLHRHVVGEVYEVRATDIRLHMSVLRTHAHESATQERLIIFDGVEWRHDGIYLAFVREDRHLRLGIERLHDVIFRDTSSLQGAIAVALAHGAHQDIIDLFGRNLT